MPPQFNKPYMHHNHGDWAVPLRLANKASTSRTSTASKNTCRQFYELLSILSRGYKSKTHTDLRPKGVSSRRHTDVTQALYTTGRPAKKSGHARIWPNRIWPKPHLAKKIRIWPGRFRDRIWPNRIWPELVFQSVDRIWPNRVWPILVF